MTDSFLPSRRTVCAGLAAAPFVGAGAARAAAPPAYAGAIDIHCHIFNADDLPVRGFVKHAVLEAGKGGLLAAPKALAAFIVGLIARLAPSADRERARLGAGSWLALADASDRAVIFEDQLARALEELAAQAAGRGFGPPLAPPDALPDAPDPLDPLDPPDPLEAPSPAEAQELLDILLALSRSEAGLLQGPNPRPEAVARGLNRLIADYDAGLPEAQVQALGLTWGGVIRGLAWAKLMLGWRSRILARYDKLFGGPEGVAMITPSLVDYGFWLQSEPGAGSTPERQVKTLAALARAGARPLVHGLAPFDPLRAIFTSDTDPFDLIEWAVEEMGFLGVKIYPPMGFYPIDNEGRGADFAKKIRRELSNAALARDLDRVLNRLYGWAAAPQRQVPILAHATESYGGRPGYAARARPLGWDHAFDSHPGLKVALAHFGDFDKARDKTVWDEDLLGLMDRYAGTHADLSYLFSAMGEDDKTNRKRAKKLKAFAEAGHGGRILFGTDWSLIALARNHKAYLAGLDAHLDRAGFDRAARRRVFQGNAVRLLGLEAGQPGRARLERFYDRQGLDFAPVRAIAS